MKVVEKLEFTFHNFPTKQDMKCEGFYIEGQHIYSPN